MKVLACFNCKEYVPIHLNSLVSEKKEKSFRSGHKGHAIFTTDLSELEGFSIAHGGSGGTKSVPKPNIM